MFGKKRKKIEKLEMALEKGRNEIEVANKQFQADVDGGKWDIQSEWMKGQSENLLKKTDELNDLEKKIEKEKYKIDNSMLSKIKQAGDIVIGTRKMLEDAECMMVGASYAIQQAKKTTKTIGTVGAIALSVSVLANVATIMTCLKLSGKNVKIVHWRKK